MTKKAQRHQPHLSNRKIIFWFRRDLRLTDNPGFVQAVTEGSVIPVFILDQEIEHIGAASQWWLYQSLQQLNQSLDNQLNFYRGDALEILSQLVSHYNIDQIYWSKCYEPNYLKNDKKIIETLGVQNCTVFDGQLLWNPNNILTKDQSPYKVFTPFYKNGCLNVAPPRKPLPQPKSCTLVKISTIDLQKELNQWNLQNAWSEKLTGYWEPGEKNAHQQFSKFIEKGIKGYAKFRDFPDRLKTSRLSPYLHFGEISPHFIWHEVNALKGHEISDEDAQKFLSELAWREFSYYLLYHFPTLPEENFQDKFNTFSWKFNQKHLRAWQTGQTGYPIIDAGMRELWETGYMHNRVRMMVASFLVKNLLIHWHHGRDWFWDCLVDADLANNSASWQWVAGSGADAAPYFRIFNPILQSEKFDPNGDYIRQFVPEIKRLPDKYLYKPWEAPKEVLKKANIFLGETYPRPIIDLKYSRNRALEAYKQL